jgi:cyclophilin family peptidyl-prolyl cis-trans isomerase
MAVLAITSPAMAKKKAKAPVRAEVVTTTAEPAITPDNLWHIDLSTGGAVVIALRPDKAPAHVERIKVLTRAGFYNGLLFHRVIEGFMAQTGDPKGTGEGGSTLPDLKAEFNDLPHLRGTVSMARAEGVNSANSQFFIVLQPVMRLDNKYTPFGRVQSGMNFVDTVERGEPPANPSKIVKAWIESDGPNAAPVPLPVSPAPAMVAPPQALPSGVPPK